MSVDRIGARHDRAVELIDGQVRELVRREGIDPLRDPGAVRTILQSVVREYDDRSLTGMVPPLEDPEAIGREVLDRVAGFGPLQRFLDDPGIARVF